jgi:hypothetical protein
MVSLYHEWDGREARHPRIRIDFLRCCCRVSPQGEDYKRIAESFISSTKQSLSLSLSQETNNPITTDTVKLIIFRYAKQTKNKNNQSSFPCDRLLK